MRPGPNQTCVPPCGRATYGTRSPCTRPDLSLTLHRAMSGPCPNHHHQSCFMQCKGYSTLRQAVSISFFQTVQTTNKRQTTAHKKIRSMVSPPRPAPWWIHRAVRHARARCCRPAASVATPWPSSPPWPLWPLPPASCRSSFNWKEREEV